MYVYTHTCKFAIATHEKRGHGYEREQGGCVEGLGGRKREGECYS